SDRLQARPGLEGRDDACAYVGMLLHALLLAGIERPALEQDRLRDTDLAYVVNDAAAVERILRRVGQPEPHAEVARGFSDATRVPLGQRILGLDRGREREDHLLRAVERVVKRLEPKRGPHARDELRALEGFGHEVVGSL